MKASSSAFAASGILMMRFHKRWLAKIRCLRKPDHEPLRGLASGVRKCRNPGWCVILLDSGFPIPFRLVLRLGGQTSIPWDKRLARLEPCWIQQVKKVGSPNVSEIELARSLNENWPSVTKYLEALQALTPADFKHRSGGKGIIVPTKIYDAQSQMQSSEISPL